MISGKIQRILTSAFGVREYIKRAEKLLTWEAEASAECSEDAIKSVPVAKNADNTTLEQVPGSPASKELGSAKGCEDPNLLYQQQQAQSRIFCSCLWE